MPRAESDLPFVVEHRFSTAHNIGPCCASPSFAIVSQYPSLEDVSPDPSRVTFAGRTSQMLTGGCFNCQKVPEFGTDGIIIGWRAPVVATYPDA